MTKTRKQASSSIIKKEECEVKPELETKLLHGTNNATKNKNKIEKNKTTKTSDIQAQIVKVKSENEDDNKALLASAVTVAVKNSKRKSTITQDQITKLIGYLVNDEMGIGAASRKANMSYPSARKYYEQYKNDPEHKVPSPTTPLFDPTIKVTQKKIEELIHYIAHDKMTLSHAAKQANMNRDTAANFYKKYMEDPEHKIPKLDPRGGQIYKPCTQDQISELIECIVNDKMSVAAASKKVNMSLDIARKYYLKYLQDPNHETPTVEVRNHLMGKRCTDEQIKSLIGHIVNDGMTLVEASIKADMAYTTARRYYNQYLNDPNHNIPTTTESDNNHNSGRQLTLEQAKEFFSYILIDELKIYQAASKANIPESSARRYYKTYLKNPTQEIKVKDTTFSVEKMKKLIKLIQDEKMSVAAAADTVSLNISAARYNYQMYLKDPQYKFPVKKTKQYTQEDVKRLIGYIENDKMSITAAAKKSQMATSSSKRYYKMYKDDPEHKIPAPVPRGCVLKQKSLDKYAQIVADIYKNNPSIKPISENLHSDSASGDVDIKMENTEEDTEMVFKEDTEMSLEEDTEMVSEEEEEED